MILVDTSGLICALDAAHPMRARALAALRDADGPRLLSPFVLAEFDYLISQRFGSRVARTFLDEITRGAYRLEPFGAADVAAAAAVLDRFGDQDLGLADASIVVLAERHDVTNVLTLDERHFRTLRLGRRLFRILPADA